MFGMLKKKGCEQEPIIITFVGPAGCGKTTQARKLVKFLGELGVAVSWIHHASEGAWKRHIENKKPQFVIFDSPNFRRECTFITGKDVVFRITKAIPESLDFAPRHFTVLKDPESAEFKEAINLLN